MRERGQVLIYDFLFSVVIFLAVYVALNALWHGNYATGLNELEAHNLKLKVSQLSDVLVSTPGSPTNWHESVNDANSIGFALTPGKFSTTKLNAFANADYDAMKTVMGLEGLEFYLDVDDLDSNYSVTFGVDANSDSEFAFSVKRIGLIDSNLTTMTLKVWKKE